MVQKIFITLRFINQLNLIYMYYNLLLNGKKALFSPSGVILQTFFVAFFTGVVLSPHGANAQGVSVSPNNATADPSAIFDVSAPDKGILIPRLSTAQRDAIANPAEALMIYNTSTNC